MVDEGFRNYSIVHRCTGDQVMSETGCPSA